MQFVEKNEGFLKLATYLRSKERQQNQAQMSIITDFLDLINSDIIITHIHFILGFYKSFFKQHYDILKSIDKITKTAGHMSYNMTVGVFSVHTDIKRIKVTFEINEHFQSFNERKIVFEGDEDTSIILFENLPKLYFKETEVFVKNYSN